MTVTSTSNFNGVWDFGHELCVQFDGQENRFVAADDGMPTTGYQKRSYLAGKIRIDREVMHRFAIRASSLSRTNGQGFTMSMVKLQPTKK